MGAQRPQSRGSVGSGLKGSRVSTADTRGDGQFTAGEWFPSRGTTANSATSFGARSAGAPADWNFAAAEEGESSSQKVKACRIERPNKTIRPWSSSGVKVAHAKCSALQPSELMSPMITRSHQGDSLKGSKSLVRQRPQSATDLRLHRRFLAMSKPEDETSSLVDGLTKSVRFENFKKEFLQDLCLRHVRTPTSTFAKKGSRRHSIAGGGGVNGIQGVEAAESPSAQGPRTSTLSDRDVESFEAGIMACNLQIEELKRHVRPRTRGERP